MLASAAGYVAGHVVHPEHGLGVAYDKAMQSKVFDPLGMAATTFDYRAAQAVENHARPHSVMTIVPGMTGLEFVVGEGDGKTLIMRDAQHEYVFDAI